MPTEPSAAAVRPPGAEPDPGSGRPARAADPRTPRPRMASDRPPASGPEDLGAAGRGPAPAPVGGGGRWAAGAAAVAWVVSRTPLLDVDRVAVVGVERHVGGRRRRRRRDPVGRGACSTSTWPRSAARIDDLPWVAAVDGRAGTGPAPSWSASRSADRWPWPRSTTGEWAVLSADGRLMEVAPEPPPGLIPLVDVPPVTEGARLEPETVDAAGRGRGWSRTRSPPGWSGSAPSTTGGVEIRARCGVIRIGAAGRSGRTSWSRRTPCSPRLLPTVSR